MYRLSGIVPAGQGRPLRYAVAAAQVWLTGSALYMLALLVAGRRPARTGAAEPQAPDRPAPIQASPDVRIAVLVPAHNEQAVIATAVAGLKRQDHPAGLTSLIVIADNCADETAPRAASAGAIVWERDAPDARGKGQAIAWALERIWHELPQTDAVAIVDADCAATPNLCSAIAAEIAGGGHAVQVPYEVSNAAQSPTAGLRAAGFALKHVIRARGRARLGLSCNLFGTGMGFSAAVLRRVPWPESLTEDTELFVRLTRAGYRVAFVETARVTSPMPASADEAAEQQLRWESGNAGLVRRQLPGLVWQTLRTGDVQGIGAAAELAVPSQTLLAVGGLASLGGGLLARQRWLVASSCVTIAAQATYVIGGLTAVGGAGLVLDALLRVPAFAAGRLRVLGRVAAGRGARSWVRTTRADDDEETPR